MTTWEEAVENARRIVEAVDKMPFGQRNDENAKWAAFFATREEGEDPFLFDDIVRIARALLAEGNR